jgi:hypothetical protein
LLKKPLQPQIHADKAFAVPRRCREGCVMGLPLDEASPQTMDGSRRDLTPGPLRALTLSDPRMIQEV